MSTIIQLGDEVRDLVSGFKGIAIGRTEWLYGCARIEVQPKIKKDGTMPDSKGFDELQLKMLKMGEAKKATSKQRKVGGPMPSPQRKKTPTRN